MCMTIEPTEAEFEEGEFFVSFPATERNGQADQQLLLSANTKCSYISREVDIRLQHRVHMVSFLCRSINWPSDKPLLISYSTSTTQTKFMWFIDRCGVYQQFVSNFSIITAPLTNLLWKSCEVGIV